MKWLEKIRDIIWLGQPQEGNRKADVTSRGESLFSKGQRCPDIWQLKDRRLPV